MGRVTAKKKRDEGMFSSSRTYVEVDDPNPFIDVEAFIDIYDDKGDDIEGEEVVDALTEAIYEPSRAILKKFSKSRPKGHNTYVRGAGTSKRTKEQVKGMLRGFGIL